MAIQKFTISRDNSIYEAFPDIVRIPSGKLIVTFIECEHHLNREKSRIMLTESHDRGRTWSSKTALCEAGTRESFVDCPRISLLSDGTLSIIATRVYGDENKNAELLWWLGDAEGKSFEGPRVLPFCGIVPDKVQILSNGRMIMAAHFYSRESDKLEQYLWYSDNHGKSWSDRVTLAADPRYNLCEVSILEIPAGSAKIPGTNTPCPSGTLVAFLRENSFTGVDMLKAFSFDYGATWSPVYETPMDCGHRPTAGFLNDGRVMVTYRYISGGCQNMFAAFLRPQELLETERHRQHARIMPLDYDRNVSPDTGYTGWTQFEDGEIYIVNYIKDDADKAYIRGYSLHPEDIELPPGEHTTPMVFK